MGLLSWLKGSGWNPPAAPIAIGGRQGLRLTSTLPWTGYVDGDDVVVSKVTCTFFGGDHDPQDDGTTASGVNTRNNPDVMGCALPVIQTVKGKRYLPTCESPIAITPHIPWKTQVQVTAGGNIITVPLIDNGPNMQQCATHAIDLTEAAFIKLGGVTEVGRMTVSYRILGVAHLFA